MRNISTLVTILLVLTVTGCSGIDTQPADSTRFEAANYRYYTWRTPPLKNTTNSRDTIYVIEPLVREAVDDRLQALGYRREPKLAEFDVHVMNAPGSRQGVASEEVSNINTRPQAINRRVDQATIDNANALAGVRDTENILVTFNDLQSNEEVWNVFITKIIEDANRADSARLRKTVKRAIDQGLDTLPPAK
jgi:hypothetical protein